MSSIGSFRIHCQKVQLTHTHRLCRRQQPFLRPTLAFPQSSASATGVKNVMSALSAPPSPFYRALDNVKDLANDALEAVMACLYKT